MRKVKVIQFSVVVLILAAVLAVSSIFASSPDRKKKDDLYKEVELFSDVVTIVQKDYVDEVDYKKLIYGALGGMLSSLDPHSQFMDPEAYNELKVETEGKFGGLGIEITVKDGLLTIVSPIEDTPAWKAGIKPGDIIVKIDSVLTRDISLSEAVKKLRGKPGTEVALTVLREKEKKILEFKISRDMINIKDIKEPRILENNIGYVRIVEFRENTADNLRKALDELKKQGMDSLILDLRNNPGGLLDMAASATEPFLAQGKVIVSTKGRKDNQNMEFVSRRDGAHMDIPMVVLVNEGSASGSEIVAGALQDYKRAIILGKKSFGKGSVQTVIPLVDGSALRLTTSKYFTPNGRSIHGQGIIPDIEVEDISLADMAEMDKKDRMIEIFEDLEGKSQPPEAKPKAEDGQQKPQLKKPQDYKDDNQLMRAVDLLKAIKIYGKQLQK
ncbi:MAG: S41 family peptidase [Candidatus Omnitrophota bacterium]|jgi:carboxyl-terminal processing protease